MVNPAVEARWATVEQGLQHAVHGTAPVVRIPGWEPTDLAVGLQWLRMNVYEGFEVDYLVERDGESATLWLKSWEHWDPEKPSDSEVPTWDEVKATPVASRDEWL